MALSDVLLHKHFHRAIESPSLTDKILPTYATGTVPFKEHLCVGTRLNLIRYHNLKHKACDNTLEKYPTRCAPSLSTSVSK